MKGDPTRRSRARVVQYALVLGLVPVARHASAQEATSSALQADSANTGSAGADSSTARAHALELSEAASANYDRGDFEAAVSLLEKAYAEFAEPVLLYDMGRAHEGLGEDQAAIDDYERYLAASPDQQHRGAVERRLRTLRQRATAKRCPTTETATILPHAAPAVAAPSRAREPSVVRQVAPWVTTGVGVLTLASGGVLWLLAEDRHALAQAESELALAEQHQRDAEALARAGTVTLVLGGILTAAGATWTVVTLTSRRDPKGTPELGLGVRPGAIYLSSKF